MARTDKPTARIHKRLPLPPPPQRSSLALWPDLDALDDDLAWAMFLITRRMRALADATPRSLSRWVRGLEVRAAAAGAPEIGADLRLLVNATSAANKNQRPLAAACFRLAEWADGRAIPELAIQFASAAVAFDPNNPEQAYLSARLHRRLDRWAEAEVLYGRAIWLGRAAKQWSFYIRGHLGLGKIHQERGEHAAAMARYVPAANAAWSLSGEKWLAGITEHDLLMLSIETHKMDDALVHALQAHRWTPKHAQSVPALVHDIAVMLVRMRAYGLAAPLLRAASAKFGDAGDRAIASSSFAFAAAGVGNLEGFREVRESLLGSVGRFAQRDAGIHHNLAAGAHLLGLLADAEWHAVRSIDIATARRELGLAAEARSILEAVRRGAPPARARIDDPPSQLRNLAHDLETRLAVWRGPTWKRKRQSGVADLGEV